MYCASALLLAQAMAAGVDEGVSESRTSPWDSSDVAKVISAQFAMQQQELAVLLATELGPILTPTIVPSVLNMFPS